MTLSGKIVEIRATETYSRWFRRLRDGEAKLRITNRVRRLSEGNPGDVAPVGEGVSELRIDYGPGYRVYYAQRGRRLIILLAGGDKDTQPGDIANARRLARTM